MTDISKMYGGPILAPMVRAGFAGMRATALKYGASLIYTDAVVCRSIIRSDVFQSQKYIFFVKNKSKVLMLKKDELDKIVVQLAGDNCEDFAEAARRLRPYCAGIDINAGCTREWTNGAMGANLLKNTKLIQIVKTLRSQKDLNVSVKIRLLDTFQETVNLANELFQCGVAAVAVHSRKVDVERDSPADFQQFIKLAQIVQKSDSQQLIANGGLVDYFRDVQLFYKMCDEGGVKRPPLMLATGAIRNPSIFGLLTGKLKKYDSSLEVYAQMVKDIRDDEVQEWKLKERVPEQFRTDEKEPYVQMKDYKFQEVKTSVMLGLKQLKADKLDIGMREITWRIQQCAKSTEFDQLIKGLEETFIQE